eukprot:scaffold2423_cov113-Isochrysis_galbana.AAC.9
MPNFSNFSGNSTGYCTTSCSSRLTPSRPPMSSQLTLGTSMTVSRSADGFEVPRATRKCSCETAIESRTSASISSSSSLGAQGGEVGADVAVGLLGELLKVDIIRELHVLGVNAQDLEAAILVGDTDVHLAVKAAEASERGINRVGAVGGTNDHDMRSRLEPVHKGEQLRYDAALDFALRLLTLRGDGVGLGLSCKLGHDLGAIDEEEESTRLIRNRPRDQRLARARRPKHEDAAWGLHTDGLEELRVAQWQLDELADVGQLLAHATNVIIADVVLGLFIVALDRLALAMNDRVRGDDAVLSGVGLDHLEFDRPHAATDKKQVVLAHRAVSLQKVRLEEDIKQIACTHAKVGGVGGADSTAWPVATVRIPERRGGGPCKNAHR